MLLILLMSLLAAPPDTADVLPYYPEAVETVEVDGRAIAYHDSGVGDEVVLFVHGLGSNLSIWRHNLGFFSDRYRVLALDLPGYGLSGKGDVPGTMAFFSDIIAGFLDALNVDAVHYVGVSMGGQIGMTFVLDHPERVRRLVLASPAGIETFTDDEAAGLRAVYTPASIQNTPPAAVAQSIALNFDAYDAARDGWLLEQREALARRADFADYAVANVRSVAGMLDGPVYDRLGALKAPTLVFFGAGDRLIPNRFLHPNMTPQDVAQAARQAMPHARVELVPQAGHLVMQEQIDLFNQRTLAFLAE